MPIISEIALSYAQRIENALKKDSFKPNARISEELFNGSHTYYELIKINDDIKKLTYTANGKKITEATKNELVDEIIVILTKKDIFPVYDSLKENICLECASNDHFSSLGETIQQILRDNK